MILRQGAMSIRKKIPSILRLHFFIGRKIWRKEICVAGFSDIDIIAIEGPILFAKDLDQHWKCTESKAKLLEYVRLVEREPSIMGMSNHIAAVATKS